MEGAQYQNRPRILVQESVPMTNCLGGMDRSGTILPDLRLLKEVGWRPFLAGRAKLGRTEEPVRKARAAWERWARAPHRTNTTKVQSADEEDS